VELCWLAADNELVHMAALSRSYEAFWFYPLGNVASGARSACEEGARQGAGGLSPGTPSCEGPLG